MKISVGNKIYLQALAIYFQRGDMKDLWDKVKIPFIALDKYNNVIDTFQKLRTDQDRVRYALNMLSDMGTIPYLYSDAVHMLKNAKDSEKLRKEGNNVFVRLCHSSDSALCHKALGLYTKSLAFAPRASSELSLAHANRSAALFELGLYSECIQDIDRALNLNYPDDLKWKLYLRKTKCLIVLRDHTVKSIIRKARYWINKMTQEPKRLKLQAELDVLCRKIQQHHIQNNPVKQGKSENKPSLPVIRSYNKEIPCASDAVTLKYDEYNGRHVVATRDIDVGEVLIVEKPYSMMLLQENIHNHCANCLRVCWTTIPCKHCTYAMYCSEQCRDIAWKQCHNVECAVFPVMLSHNFDDGDLLSLRIAVLAVNEAGDIQRLRTMLEEVDKNNDPRTKGFSPDGTFHSNKYISLYSLKRNTDKRLFVDVFTKTVRTCLSLYFLAKHTEFFGANLSTDLEALATNENVTFLGGLILRNQQIIPTNAYSYCEVRDLEINDCGYAFMAFSSLFNHSCSANIAMTTRPQHIVSHAVLPIKKGEQLLSEYGTHFTVMPKLARQRFLFQQYLFICGCVACEENWPMYDDCKSFRILAKTTKDAEIMGEAFEKCIRCFDLAMTGDVFDKPYLFEDMCMAIRVLYNRVPIACREFNLVVETLKRVYEYHGNNFVMPTIRIHDI